MATLQELFPMVDEGRAAVLILSKDYPENDEKQNLKIFISLTSNGLYQRRLIYTDEALPVSPVSNTYNKWRDLLFDISAVESKSDQWRLDTNPLQR